MSYGRVENGRAGELGNGFPEMGVGRREPIREVSGQMPAGPASVGRRKKRVSGLSDWREVGLDKTNHHSMSQVCDTSHFPTHCHACSLSLTATLGEGQGHSGTGNGAGLEHGRWRAHQGSGQTGTGSACPEYGRQPQVLGEPMHNQGQYTLPAPPPLT